MNTVRRIAKNTLVLLIAQIISTGLGFFYTMYTAPYLGAEGFGVLSFALAFTGIFGVFSDLGLSTLTTREVIEEGMDEDKSKRYIFKLKALFNLVMRMKMTKAIYKEGVLKPLEKMDLKEGEEVEIILMPYLLDLEERVRELENYLSTNTPKPFVSELERGYKWFTEEYSLRKLGLKE